MSRSSPELSVTVSATALDISLGLPADPDCGAEARFLGQVRGGDGLVSLTLEHYPGVTEQALSAIGRNAAERFNLRAALIHHRVGTMEVGEPIVLVAASAPHRKAALQGVEFMMDQLKTHAPFWKKEAFADGRQAWVEARVSDDQAAKAWFQGDRP
ncbi:MAG: molybdenum cofactor biosynthesis protein MoaE [Maricaulaceae bacterium]